MAFEGYYNRNNTASHVQSANRSTMRTIVSNTNQSLTNTTLLPQVHRIVDSSNSMLSNNDHQTANEENVNQIKAVLERVRTENHKLRQQNKDYNLLETINKEVSLL